MRGHRWRAAAVGILFSLLAANTVWADPEEKVMIRQPESQEADESAAGGEEDPQTQLLMKALLAAASGEEEQTAETPDFTIEYDAGQDMYRYLLDGTVWFAASAPKDSMVSGPVRIQMGESQYILNVRCNDGTLKTAGDLSDRHSLMLTEPGSYDISIYSQAGMDELLTRDQVGTEEMEKMLSSGRRVSLHYQLIAPETGAPETVNAPDGFRLISAHCGGKILPVSDQTQFLEEDGAYEFQFALPDNPDVTYILNFELDRTAPYLTFEGNLDGLEGRTPVKVTASQKDAVITVHSSAGTYSFSGSEGMLSSAGSYWLTVQDPLGNERSYRLFLAQSNRRVVKLIGLAAVGALLGILTLSVRMRGEKTDEIR